MSLLDMLQGQLAGEPANQLGPRPFYSTERLLGAGPCSI